MAAERRHCWLALVLLLWLVADPVHACRCREQSLAEFIAAAERVAEARIVHVATTSQHGQNNVRRYQVEIIQRFKGLEPGQVFGYATTASCGVSFLPGERIWVLDIRDY